MRQVSQVAKLFLQRSNRQRITLLDGKSFQAIQIENVLSSEDNLLSAAINVQFSEFRALFHHLCVGVGEAFAIVQVQGNEGLEIALQDFCELLVVNNDVLD